MTQIQEHMWTEKYRPQQLHELYGHELIVDVLRDYLDDGGGSLPHLILSGPPGTGKTATITAYARELYGEEYFEANFRELNASDDRGIDVVREQIKGWARRAPSGGYPYKILFLDEADALTNQAQSALRRLMEQYHAGTRFVLSCNYANELIDPIQSRCGAFHLGRLDTQTVHAALERIAAEEQLAVDADQLDRIAESSRGRLRDAIISLQLSTIEGSVDTDRVELFTGVVDRELIKEITSEALEGELDEAQRRLDVEVLKEGADPQQVCEAFFSALRSLDLAGDHAAKCYELLATIQSRLRSGIHPRIQFHAFLAHIYMSRGLSPTTQQQEGS